MFCYSNNGYSMRAVDADYIAQAGEVIFVDYATDAQLAAVFPSYVSIAARQAQAASIAAAQAELEVSDMVALRCFKAGVAFGSDWQEHVVACRAIVSSGTGTVPARPAYPAGS